MHNIILTYLFITMKYLRQFLIIITISLIGEILKELIPVSIPASIYGMLILFVCLMTGFIKIEHVKDVGKFLIEIMPIMFIPAGVGLMSSWDVLRPALIPIIIITVVTIITVMAATGLVSQSIIRFRKSKKSDSEEQKDE